MSVISSENGYRGTGYGVLVEIGAGSRTHVPRARPSAADPASSYGGLLSGLRRLFQTWAGRGTRGRMPA